MVFSLAGSGLNHSGSCWVPTPVRDFLDWTIRGGKTHSKCGQHHQYMLMFVYLPVWNSPDERTWHTESFLLACFQFSWQVCLFSCCGFPPQYETQFLWTPSIDRRPPALQQPSNRSSAGGDCWDILPYELSNSWDSQPLPLMNYPDHVM